MADITKNESESTVYSADSFVQRKIFLFAAGCIMGIIAFGIIFGFHIVNPAYDDWIFSRGGDTAQHHLGWLYYRRSDWSFPFGLIDGLIANEPIPFIFTDSIPVFAILFKLLSPVLPETFQYIGLWELTSFMLMGGLSAVLLRRFSKNPFFCIIGSIPYIIAAPVIQRSFAHEALSGQWIIVAAMILFAYRDYPWKHKATPVILWSLTGCTAFMIHSYFIPMVYMVMCGYIFADIFKGKKILRSVAVFCSTTAVTLAVMFLMGAFYGKPELSDLGLGKYAANYNALFNSMNYSKFLKPLNTNNSGKLEGFGYMGLGMIILMFISVIIAFHCAARKEGSTVRNILRLIKKYWVIAAAGFIIMAVSFFIAASPEASLNGRPIYTINYPEKITQFLSIFRASGRFIWVALYLVFTASFAVLSKFENQKTIIFIAFMCVSVQCLDLRDFLREKHTLYGAAEYTYSSPLETEEFSEISENKTEIIFLPLPGNYLGYSEMYFTFAEFAIRKNMSLSSFYISRDNFQNMQQYSLDAYEQLKNGNVRDDVLYVFFEPSQVPENRKNFEVHGIGGYLIAVKK